jgi:hypothetical protein
METDEFRVLLFDFAKVRVCWKKDFMLAKIFYAKETLQKCDSSHTN